MPLLNSFKLGADPEFAILNGDRATVYTTIVDPLAPWGVDHGGYVIEPHPKPTPSVRELVANLKVSMNDFATVAPTGRWRAGACVTTDQRTLTFGGHVHIDKPRFGEEIPALDLFTQHMERLDIFPNTECLTRRNLGNYGRLSDVRVEHGHFEYRTFPSMLYSQRVTKLCFLAAKLATVDPAAVRETMGRVEQASLPRLRAFYERFKSKDDDVDWVLDSGVLNRRLVVDPSRDLKDVWRVTPQKEDPHWKAESRPQTPPIRNGLDDDLRTMYLAAGDVPFEPYVYSHINGANGQTLLISVSKSLGIRLWTAVVERIRNMQLPLVRPGGTYFVQDRAFSFGCIGVVGEPDEEGLFTQRWTQASPTGYVRYLLHRDTDVGTRGVRSRLEGLTNNLVAGVYPDRTRRIGNIDTYNGLPHIALEVHRN